MTAWIPTPARGTGPARYSFLQPDSASVIIETIKQAEDNSDLVIRAFDSLGCRGEVKFAVAAKLKRIRQSNLMEEEEQPVTRASEREFTDVIQPYEIKTYKIRV